MSKVALLAKITAKEGQRDALATEFRAAFEHVAAEQGTLTYILHEDANEADILWFYELYTDQDALAAHGSSEWMKQLGPKLGPLMAGRAELIFLNPIGGKGLD